MSSFLERFTTAKDTILHIEKEFPVNSWKLNDVQLWPFIRIQLFFFIIDPPKTNQSFAQENTSNFSASNNTKKTSFLHKVIFYTKLKINPYLKIIDYIKYKNWLRNISQKDFLFIGHNHHRIDFNAKRYNRFYDPIIEKHKLENNFSILEYWSTDESNITHKQNSIQYEKGKELYQKSLPWLQKTGKVKIKINLENKDYNLFLDYLNTCNHTKGFIAEFIDLQNRFKVITHYTYFYNNLLSNAKPKYLFTLCYYVDEIMLLLHLANSKKINTIEMQHGPIAQNHLSYGYWSNIPTNGYSCLPKNFWCWDETSKNSIYNLVHNSNNFYSAFIGGHPWVSYWQTKTINIQYTNYVLYTLQPIFTPQQLFPETIVKLILNNKYKWLIRLHPRQLEDKQNIINYLTQQNIIDFVDIETGTNETLPALLKNALLHVTHSSGGTLEAAMFNVKTVLLDELGKKYYEELITTGKAVYLNVADANFETQFNNITAQLLNTNKSPILNKIDEEIIANIFHQKTVTH